MDDLFELRSFKKGEQIEETGKKSDEFGVLIEGILRGYYIMENGREKTKAFRYPGTFFANYWSILTKSPSRFTIQAIKGGEAWFASYSTFIQRTQNILFWQTFLRKVTELEYLNKEQREYELLTQNSHERYINFLNEYEIVKDEIPQYHVANYLGIDPSSLNRIIKKIEVN